jgi:hypothetical protein
VGFELLGAGLSDTSEPVVSQPDEHGIPERAGPETESEGRAGMGITDTGLDKRFRMAMALYGILGLLVWFTMGEGKVLVHGRPVELRLVPLIVIGGLALRTAVAHHAEKIRQGGNGSSSL